LNSKIKRYVVGGGGARSELWRQIIADVTGKQVFRATNEEASALGAGILAAAAVGLYEDVSQAARGMARWEETFTEPDAQRHEFYTRMFMDVYSGLYPALRETMSNLTLMY
jgi:xylulokinase